MHYTDLDKNVQRSYLMEFSKLTDTSLYRLCTEIVAMLNAELDHGTFKVDPAPAPSPEWSEYKDRKYKNMKEKKDQEVKQGSLIGKNDRSRMNSNVDTSSIAGHLKDFGLDL